MATSYHVNGGDIRCDKETSVIPDQTFEYTAACVNNEALVTVYVHDKSLNTTDNPAVPAYCVAPDVVGNKVAYNFTLPCDCSIPLSSIDSSPSPAPTSVCDFYDVTFDDMSLASGAYVSHQWMDVGFGVTAKVLEPSAGGYTPNGYARLFDTANPVDTPDLAGDYGNVLIIQQSGVAADQMKANTAGGIITFEFATPMDEVLELGLLNVVKEVKIVVTDVDEATRTFVVSAAGARSHKNIAMDVSKVTMIQVFLQGPTAITHLSTCKEYVAESSSDPVVLATNKLVCGSDIFEDYESRGQSESWQHGSEYDDDKFTTFLGRLGRENPVVSKVFDVPVNSDSVDITFDFYDIDGMPSADKIYVGVQGSYLDLDLFKADGSKKFYNDIQVTGTLSANRNISFKSDKSDSIYAVKMTIPKYWYEKNGYKLRISFKIETATSINKESYGIDNFRLHASCKRRQLDSEDGSVVSPPASEPDESGDDGSFYCLSVDFPCEGGAGMVNVCHYSTRKGYETFCIPEADSEILRFYTQDYCGPCVGGFGGVNNMVQ
jgi:hypothetical protein